ncbi:MAG: cysteine desulfurase, partial [Lachnospiraceae bacterium]|nr:cysteine desulfurase [Lachnospiraceae bacterium]
AALMTKIMTEDYGNPSSMHFKGIEAEKYVKDARTIIAKTLKCKEKEILFTSGGTESDNMALIGCAMAGKRKGMHLITTAVEHPAILQTMQYLEKQGFTVTYLPVNKEGILSIEDLKQALTKETILVSIMHTNNEVGAIQPIEEAGKVIKEYDPAILFHVDAVQGYGKNAIYPKKMNIDLLSVSGHKLHGPKGVGFLYVGEKVKINPILFGGGQQGGLRSGTENVPGIAGLARACEEIYEDLNENREKLFGLKEQLCKGLQQMEEVTINGPKGKEGAPHIVSASFRGVRSEVLLHALEDKGICVSAGSACATNRPHVSDTLTAMQVDKELLDSTIRFSLSEFTTAEELDYTLQTLYDVVPVLRKYMRH